MAIITDARLALTELFSRIKENNHTDWIDSFNIHEQEEFNRVIRDEIHPLDGELNMGEVVNFISEATNHSAVLVTDVGQNQMISSRYFKYKQGRSIVTSGG